MMERRKFFPSLFVRQKTRQPVTRLKRISSSPSLRLTRATFRAYLTFVLLSSQFNPITCLNTHHECPSNHLLKSLIHKEDHGKFDCYCTYDPSHERDGGGWDISCLKQFRSSTSSRQVNITKDSNPETGIKNKPMSGDDDDTSDLQYSTLESTAFEFTIKHESRRAIEIACYDSSPDFKPAMFQGASLIIFSLSLKESLSLKRFVQINHFHLLVNCGKTLFTVTLY